MRINGSVALVTGASSGIGRHTAAKLAQAGAQVIVHGRSEAQLAQLADQIGAVAIAGDLSTPGEAERLAAAALRVAGPLDILVNNAGIGWAGPFAAMSPATMNLLIAVNLTAPIALTRALLPAMIERDTGCIVFVTSIAGRTGVGGEAVYAATKAGLDIFAESLRIELHGTGLRVGVFVPGVVDTPFYERRGQPYGRAWPAPAAPEPVASTLVGMIASGRAERYSPRWLRLPVVVRAAVPVIYRRLVTRFGVAADLATGHQAPGRG